MEKLYKKFGDRIEFIGVNLGFKNKVQEFVKDNGLTFPVTYDEGNKLATIFSAKIETNILIDRSGVVKFKSREFQENMEEHLRRLSEEKQQ